MLAPFSNLLIYAHQETVNPIPTQMDTSRDFSFPEASQPFSLPAIFEHLSDWLGV
jgi:hypothetical protein